MATLDKELDKEQFFQTNASIEKQKERSEKIKVIQKEYGEPFHRGSSQILSVVEEKRLDGQPPSFLFVTESAFIVKKVALTNGKIIQKYRGHNGPVPCCAHLNIPTLGEFLFSGSWDKTIKRWDVEFGKEISTFEGHSDFVKALTLHIFTLESVASNFPDVKMYQPFLFSGSSDKTIKMWNVETGECLRKFEGHKRGIESIVCRSDVEHIYSSSSDGSIRQWNIVTGECLGIFEGHLTNVFQILIIDDLDFWSASADQTVRCWDLASRKCTQIFKHAESVRSFAIYDRYLISGSRDEKVHIWDRVECREINAVNAHLDEVSCILQVGKYLFSGSYDSTIRRWEIGDLCSKRRTPGKATRKTKQVEMTEEEAKELEELMNED